MSLIAAESIRIEGIVQGVGFRPTVWRLARECGLQGWVRNDCGGVLLRIWGSIEQRDRLLERLQAEPPPLARIDRILRLPLTEPGKAPTDFHIEDSGAGAVRTGVAADAATCPACRLEVFDPADRRCGYAFTNCTHCGPRLSIVRSIPYDRVNTSMASFPLCPQCQREYDDPADRRFHAQPNACHACGPRLWLEDLGGTDVRAADPIAETANRIRRGDIVAIKGLGGFHLACDAANASAVARLRERKHRYGKAFALMARDCDSVTAYATLSDIERAAMQQPAAPIVLLKATRHSLPAAISPGLDRIGFMLPYTALHHLLMRQLDQPIVLTSGNRSDEPQCIANDEARSRLGNIADAVLMHDRDIVNRLDDSVLHVADGRPRLLRRARGYAPASLTLPAGFGGAGSVLAMGAELKNCFGLIKDGQAILSQHIGDLEDAATRRDYQHCLSFYHELFQHHPDLVAVDLHPDYASTEIGQSLAAELGVPCVPVQHHHAHIAACLTEHGWPIAAGKVLGIALDGLGLGEDRQLWGGEFFAADYLNAERLASFAPIAMPGGFRAIKEPWRNAYAHLDAALGWNRVIREFGGLEAIRQLQSKPLATLARMIEQGLNSPRASSCGRLFDAAATLLGLGRDVVSYEGQAACELEALAAGAGSVEPYGSTVASFDGLTVLDWTQLWEEMLRDLSDGVDPADIAARFHEGVAAAVTETALVLCRRESLTTAALSGGSFQNRLLLEGVARRLRETGITVIAPENIPANDGGIALGQAVIAAARYLA